ncbi:hypothetical protein [Marivirga tractuosa]|uniref:hypothetical protein n=1 Tax=Marivirga tractuosa TaxID=1006 RepID=UPI0011D27C84|nr:hypothetical protein [Marivirga tractuosa]
MLSILIVSVLLVPSQSDYFQRLEYDFRAIHQSNALNRELLEELGDYTYRNRLLFSEFEYSFGNISVSYYGFLNIIMFEDPINREVKSPQITV